MTTAKRRRAFLDPTAEQELNTFAQQYFPTAQRQDILDEIASTGTISAASLAKIRANPSDSQFITSEVNRITGGKPTGQAKLKELLSPDKPINEANLTDEELQNRQQQFQALGESTGTADPASIQRFIEDKFKAYGVLSDRTAQERSKLSKSLSDAIVGSGQTDINQAINGIDIKSILEKQNLNPNVFIDPLKNMMNDGDFRGQLGTFISDQVTPSKNTSEDISRIGDILSTRETKTANEGKVTDYLNTLPDVLSASRNDFVDVLKEQGQQELEAATPQFLAGANARGALFSGDVGDVLSTTAGGIQGNIESIQAQLEAEDNQFYFNAAYRNALRKQLEGQTDYGTFLAGERARIAGEQQTRFNRAQTTIAGNANADLQMRTGQSALTAQQARLKRERDLLDSERTAGLYGQIGQAGGAIIGAGVGAAAGGVPGAIVGSTVGGSAGGLVGKTG